MKLIPVDDRIIVKRDEAQDITRPSGLVVVASVQDTPQTATVIAVGDGIISETQGPADTDITQTRKPMRVRPGDRVILGKYSGSEYNGLTIIGPSDILAIIKEQ